MPRPRYYLPKQEFRTRGEIMESSAASFVVKIGGRLLRGTLLYLRGGGLGGRETIEERSNRAFLSRFVSWIGAKIWATKNIRNVISSRKFFLPFWISYSLGILFFRLNAKNEIFIWIIKGNCKVSKSQKYRRVFFLYEK